MRRSTRRTPSTACWPRAASWRATSSPSKAMLDDPKLSDTQKEEVRIFMATMAESDVLRPDVVVNASGDADDRRAGLRPARDRGRRHRCRSLALRRRERRRGDRRPRDVAGALLRDGLPGAVARGAGCGLGRALHARDSRPWRAHGRAQVSTRGAAHSTRSWTASKGPSDAGQCAAAWEDGIAPFVGTDEGARRQRAATPNTTSACCARTAARAPTARRSDGKRTARARRAVRRFQRRTALSRSCSAGRARSGRCRLRPSGRPSRRSA